MKEAFIRPPAFWKFAILLVFIVLSVRPARSQDTRRDGNWWRTVRLEGKTSYMLGFFDGLILGRNFSTWNLKGKDGKLGIAEGSRVISSFQEYYGLMKDASNNQFVDGLDKFYGDYRNRRIMVSDAVWIVVRSEEH